MQYLWADLNWTELSHVATIQTSKHLIVNFVVLLHVERLHILAVPLLLRFVLFGELLQRRFAQFVSSSIVRWQTLHCTSLLLPQGQHCSKIMKPLQSLPLQVAECLVRAQPDSVANHVTTHSISDWCALTWLATETGYTRRKCSAICCGKLISVHKIWYDVTRKYGI